MILGFPHIEYVQEGYEKVSIKKLQFLGGNMKEFTIGKTYELYISYYSPDPVTKRKMVWVTTDDNGKFGKVDFKLFGNFPEHRDKKLKDLLK